MMNHGIGKIKVRRALAVVPGLLQQACPHLPLRSELMIHGMLGRPQNMLPQNMLLRLPLPAGSRQITGRQHGMSLLGKSSLGTRIRHRFCPPISTPGLPGPMTAKKSMLK